MKIALCVTTDLNYDQRMRRICSALAEAGYKVELVGREKKDSLALEEMPYSQKRLKCWFEKGKLFYLEYNLRLFWHLRKSKMDTICAVDLDTIVPCYYASKSKGIPCVYDAHEYFTELPEVVGRPLVKRIWEWVGKLYVPKMARCYTVGPALAEELSKKYGKPFGVVRNMPDEIVQEINAYKIPKIILYQGALNIGRGLEQAIEAMGEVNEGELWLAGEGDLSAMLRVKVCNLGLEDKVKFLGYLRPGELKTITRKAYIGLNLLENKGKNYHLSLANKFFDYVQAGVPSLNMAFPEYVALNKEYEVGPLLNGLTPTKIAKELNLLISDECIYQRLKSNCNQAAEKWHWGREKAKLIEIYSPNKRAI